MSAVDAFLARIDKEEGTRLLPYDDATGKLVVAPVGNLSWGRGYNLMQCGSAGLFAAMDRYLAGVLDSALQQHTWYRHASDVRASVFLDIAYNAGLHGLLGFVHMLAAADVDDWATASKECTVIEENVDKQRYAPLRAILLTNQP